MVLTKAQHKAALKHILENVFDEQPNDSIARALSKATIPGVIDMITMSHNDIQNLVYVDDTGTTMPLQKYKCNMIILFQGYINWLDRKGETPGNNLGDWTALQQDDFDKYRISADASLYMNQGPQPTPTPSTSRNDPVEQFRRGIKRDISLYEPLKDDALWDSWNAQLVATARAQGIDDVLDPTYVPSSGDKALFDEKQKFMYAVLVKCLNTDQGKTIVRFHVDTYNAQKVYAEMKTYCLQSAKAELNAADHLTYLTSAKFGDGEWRGTAEAFLLNWHDRLRKHEDTLKDKSKKLDDDLKRTLLQNAVSLIPQLNDVKLRADQYKSASGHETTYQDYHTFLTTAAQQYDRTFTKNAQSTRRKVYQHDIHSTQLCGFDDDDPSDITVYNIDTQVETIFVNQTNTGPPTKLPDPVWNKMNNKERRGWNTITPSNKLAILHARPPGHSSSPPLRPGEASNIERKVNYEETTYVSEPTPNTQEGILVAMAKNKKAHPADLQRVLSAPTPSKDTIFKDGIEYRRVSCHEITTYRVNSSKHRKDADLIDRGANGGIAGENLRIIEEIGRTVNVEGIDSHQLVDIPIVTAGGVTQTNKGPVIAIFHQYAYTGRGKSIHSSGQLERYKNSVDDRAKINGGMQRIITIDGYIIPMSFRGGLAYIPMRTFTDKEFETLPHVIMTSDEEWDPTILDSEVDTDTEEWFDAVTTELPEEVIVDRRFDDVGDYRHRHVMQHSYIHKHEEEEIFQDAQLLLEANERITTPSATDYEAVRPMLGWQPVEVIKKTFEATTQFVKIPMSNVLRKTFRSPNPAVNIHRRPEAVATDTVFSDVPAVDSGDMAAQIFVGVESLVTDAEGMKYSDKQFVNTLEDNIRKRGAMDKLISDRAQAEISNKVKDILRSLHIGDWQSEPFHQHQNFAERRIQEIKKVSNTILDRTGAPPQLWLQALLYSCFLLNHLATASLQWRTPIECLTGRTPDISPLLRFQFYEPVYYRASEYAFPSDSREERGRFVGVAEHVGHAMTYKILTDETLKIIYRSEVRSAMDIAKRNLRVDPEDAFCVEEVIRRRSSYEESPAPIVDVEALIGRTFLMPPTESGEVHRARIVSAIEDHQKGLSDNPERTKFLLSINNDTYEDVMAYNDLMNHIESQQSSNEDEVWKYKRIISHSGPMKQADLEYRGSSYNVMVEWETGEVTTEPLTLVAAEDPVMCAIYASNSNLLEKPGWKRFKSIAKRQKKFFRMANQAKLRSYRTAPKYMYGFEIPRDFQHAVNIDQRNGNTKWQDASSLELTQLDEYKTFKDMGKHVVMPSDYKKIKVHFVFAVKHDGRHKARLVADGHLTDIPVDSVYSGVVSLRGLRMVIFLAELNGLDLWATDIGNAYLEAKTQEKVYIIAGPEFGPSRQGHTLVIYKALYGLRSSGLRWHERFSDCLRSLGFVPCKEEPDIWMRPYEDQCYEYVAVYVDDLAIAMKDPASFVKILSDPKGYGFKLKGTGPMEFHLGCDFVREEDGTLAMLPRRYIERMTDGYIRMFGTKPNVRVYSPLEKGDHPELDTTPILDPDGTSQYQSLVGSMQWAISLGRLDICTAIMTLSSFNAAPRVGHLSRAKRVVGYLNRFKDAAIRFRTDIPDMSDLPSQTYRWMYSVYGDVSEVIPQDTPKPLGKSIQLLHYVDANLYHDWVTGRSVTGILHIINQTPLAWFSKKQSTVETATYGSEFVAARTATEQIIDIRNTLRYLGVPVETASLLIGDNEAVVNSSIDPNSKQHKRHTSLSFHRVREGIASGMTKFYHVPGNINPADILSKHWGHGDVWYQLRPLLFWKGNTADIPSDDDRNPSTQPS